MIKRVKSFLFENKTDKQTILKNSFWMILSEGISKGSGFLISILIARLLGPESFGIMNFVTSFVSMFIVITDFGLTTLMVREISRDHTRVQEYLVNLSFLKVLLGIITFLLILLVSLFIGKDNNYIILILIYGGYSIINNFGEFIRAFFRPSEMMQHEAFLKIINGILVIIVVGFTLFKFGDLKNIFYGYMLTGIISLIISFLYIGKKFKITKYKLNKLLIIKSLKSGMYLMGSVLFVGIISNVDKILFGYFGLEYSLGIYSAVYRIISILSLISGMYILAVMPNLIKNRSPKKIISYLAYLLLLPIVTIIISYFYGNDIINILYGIDYITKDSFIIFMMLMFVFLFNVINTYFFYFLNYLGHEKGIFYMIITTGILSIILNYILIPIYKGIGSSVTLLIIEILMTLLIFLFYRKKIVKI